MNKIDFYEKKLLYRKRSLIHYYENIDHYREYYKLNKSRLSKYNTNYKRNLRKLDYGITPNNNKTVLIEHGKFIILV